MILLSNQNKKTFNQLFYPLMIEQIFMMLIGNVNVFLLSLYHDQAVAATGLSDQILSIGTMAMGIVSLGSTVLFLQNADDRQLPYIRGVARQTFLLNFILAGFLFSITLFFGETIMSWMQTPQELLPMSVIYLRIVSSSLLFQGLSASSSALLRSYGKVKSAMSISILNTLITVSGNALVILTPLSIFGEGVLGISVATVVTRFIGAIISFTSVA
jgi:Na+-driven multidrug efflux pump